MIKIFDTVDHWFLVTKPRKLGKRRISLRLLKSCIIEHNLNQKMARWQKKELNGTRSSSRLIDCTRVYPELQKLQTSFTCGDTTIYCTNRLKMILITGAWLFGSNLNIKGTKNETLKVKKFPKNCCHNAKFKKIYISTAKFRININLFPENFSLQYLMKFHSSKTELAV